MHPTITQYAWWSAALAALVTILLPPELAEASAGAGGGLPWETPLTAIRTSATGPVAFTLSILGIVVAGGTLIFGGDMSGFFRTMVMLVLVISSLVGAGNIMNSLFSTGATLATTTNSSTPAIALLGPEA